MFTLGQTCVPRDWDGEQSVVLWIMSECCVAAFSGPLLGLLLNMSEVSVVSLCVSDSGAAMHKAAHVVHELNLFYRISHSISVGK